MRERSNRFKNRKGQLLITATLALVPMFGIMGMVTDLGYMRYIRMSAQTAAQAASTAAVIELSMTGTNGTCGVNGVVCATTWTQCPTTITTPSNAIERGCMYAYDHGFSGTNRWVYYQAGVSSVPGTAPGTGLASFWVAYLAQRRVPQMFSAVLGHPDGMVAARSTAALQGAADCIYALDPSIDGAVQAGGTANLNASCGIFVNSNNAQALGTNGGGQLNATEYDVVGGVETHYALSPTPNTGVPPITDPLALLPVPATAPYTCTYQNISLSGNGTYTLNPGTYCGGIHVGNAVVHFNPGNYILVGGGLSTQSTNSWADGTGVFFYNTFGATNNMGNNTYSFSGIDLNANSHVSFKAPTSGTYAGILFFADRNVTGSTLPYYQDNYGGGSTAVYEGTIYSLKGQVAMYGTSQTDSKYTIVVADMVKIIGTSYFKNDYSLLPSGSPVAQMVTLE